ncbi:MAG: response regulator [Acidobacteriia bacterium]|nr:response regulator [Terriglobia bacterium]
MARRILLADDSVTAQNMGRRILTDAGYEVVTVNNGSAALKKIAENKPDIIVLDVYMPGYGGLEVCQRVKEAAETARIPVLLTVGKLEPFRPDEARRVGADAFIIKPFEATELLTALTKLEDKIVAAPQPQKSGRFAKALAAVEGADFGDKETGWKNRLTIPGPNARSKQGETDAPPEVVAGPCRDFARSEAGRPAEPKQEFERPIPAGLPADITPEEIAAITAAAASFDGKAGHPIVIAEGAASDSVASMQAASAESAVVQPSEPEPPAATLASATELEQAPPAEVAAEPAPVAAEAVTEAVASDEAAKVEDHVAAAELPAAVAETETTPQAASVAQVTESGTPLSRDAEVMAAIASLAPSNGQGSESMQPASGNETGQEVAVGATSAVAAEAAITGPRWIAESIAVAVEESAATLEQEMEQASAARTAAESAAIVAATAAEIPTPTPAVETVEPAIADAVSVTEAVASAEPVPASMAVETSSAESSAGQEIAQAIAQEPEPTVAKEESAYAAAAAAGSSSERVPQAEAVSSTTVAPEISESAPAASVEVVPQREAELAAAWQNWKQIRESFVSAPPPELVAEAPAAEASAPESVPQEEPSAPAPLAEQIAETEPETPEVEAAPAEAPGESTAIASIVDTMLAELRPKLVEEIAKKMSSEKKDKEKEKEKKKKK